MTDQIKSENIIYFSYELTGIYPLMSHLYSLGLSQREDNDKLIGKICFFKFWVGLI